MTENPMHRGGSVNLGDRLYLASPYWEPSGPGLPLRCGEIGWPLAPVSLDDAITSMALATVCVFRGATGTAAAV
jgi:hypothetical protein